MYCLEGELLLRQKPETLLGLYGCTNVVELHTVDDSDSPTTYTETITRTGDEDSVITARERLIVSGEMPVETPVELISTLEQAEKYVKTSRKGFRSAQRQLDLDGALEGCVPEGLELLDGSAFLWKDKRYPTPFIYLLARGALITQVKYDQEEGWYHTHDEFEGSRTISGLVTPLTFRTKEKYQYVGTSRRGYQFIETKGNGNSHRSGYQVRVNIQLGKHPEPENPSALPKIEEGTVIRDHTGQPYVVTGHTSFTDKWDKKQKIAAGITYRRVNENGEPAGDTYTRRKRDMLRKTIKYEGKHIPLFTVEDAS